MPEGLEEALGQHSIGIVGGGAWGTALAVHLADCGHRVRQWIREAEVVEAMRRQAENSVYLPGISIPPGVAPGTEIGEVVADSELVIAAVPSQFARGVYRAMAPKMDATRPLVVATKGIEQESLALPLEVAADELGAERPTAVLSGPSFAAELALGRATAVVVASRHAELARQCQQALSSSAFRLYTNDDPLGVQLAGAMKNVFAIAAGAADGLGMGLNTQAALITRGVAEMSRLGRRLGGKAETFAGLAGVGDLVLTCTGNLSRNRRAGQALARGAAEVDGGPSVAEGIPTTRSVRDLARREGVSMPIVEEVYRMIYEQGSPQEALERLMGRPLRAETDRTEPASP